MTEDLGHLRKRRKVKGKSVNLTFKVVFRAEILPRDVLQTLGNYYLRLTIAKIQSWYCYTKTNGGSMKACQLSSVWQILGKDFFYSNPILILH